MMDPRQPPSFPPTAGFPPAGSPLAGSLCALVTPFDETSEQRLNLDLFQTLAERQRDNGTTALVPCGTTGETPTLDDTEFEAMIRASVEVVRGTTVKVIAGTGSNSTREACRLTERAAELGVDGCLIVIPYYNKPSPAGVIRHFQELDRIGIPLILYNIPGRTGINVSPETIRAIAERCPQLVSVKAANGDLEEISETCLIRSSQGPLSVLSGDDALTLPILSLGGTGVVSVIANLLPRTTAALVERFSVGDITTARAIHHATLPLARALLKLGPNPTPIKALLSLGGYRVGNGRLPLVPLADAALAQLRAVAQQTRGALCAATLAYDEVLDRIAL